MLPMSLSVPAYYSCSYASMGWGGAEALRRCRAMLACHTCSLAWFRHRKHCLRTSTCLPSRVDGGLEQGDSFGGCTYSIPHGLMSFMF